MTPSSAKSRFPLDRIPLDLPDWDFPLDLSLPFLCLAFSCLPLDLFPPGLDFDLFIPDFPCDMFLDIPLLSRSDFFILFDFFVTKYALTFRRLVVLGAGFCLYFFLLLPFRRCRYFIGFLFFLIDIGLILPDPFDFSFIDIWDPLLPIPLLPLIGLLPIDFFDFLMLPRTRHLPEQFCEEAPTHSLLGPQSLSSVHFLLSHTQVPEHAIEVELPWQNWSMRQSRSLEHWPKSESHKVCRHVPEHGIWSSNPWHVSLSTRQSISLEQELSEQSKAFVS